VAWRDPWGLRPLFFAQFEGGIAVASETSAFVSLPQQGIKIQEIAPSSYLEVEASGAFKIQELTSKKNLKSTRHYCMFENVYFSSPQSEYLSDRSEFQSVFRARMELGVALAEQLKKELTNLSDYEYVVPVPETSRTAAIVVAEQLRIPYREFLVKNPYVSRTFILNTQEARLATLNNKLTLVGPELKSKNILLVDDSVVRGNTSRMMALKLKEAGARRVALASTCPPIKHGCFYGIDFPDESELVASQFPKPSDIAQSLGVDDLVYLNIENLRVAFQKENLCTACLDGYYPTRDSSFETFLAQRKKEKMPS
jgi:amidophosphoribosyltransferase